MLSTDDIGKLAAQSFQYIQSVMVFCHLNQFGNRFLILKCGNTMVDGWWFLLTYTTSLADEGVVWQWSATTVTGSADPGQFPQTIRAKKCSSIQLRVLTQ